MEIRLNETIGENGLYATKTFAKGDIVFELSGVIYDKPTRESIRIGPNTHIVDEYGIFMNHSFEPSCEIVGKCVVALSNIEVGDELNFNYNVNEVEMACPFVVNGVLVGGKCADK